MMILENQPQSLLPKRKKNKTRNQSDRFSTGIILPLSLNGEMMDKGKPIACADQSIQVGNVRGYFRSDLLFLVVVVVIVVGLDAKRLCSILQ
jgi:hypothetical protein